MTGDDPTPPPNGPSFIERRALRIADARSVVIGLALTFVGLAFVGAIVIRSSTDNFPHWAWDLVGAANGHDGRLRRCRPTTAVGRVIGGIEMVLGISFIAFLTAGVTSIVIQRGSAKAQAVERAHDEREPGQSSMRWSRHDRRSPRRTRVLTASIEDHHERVAEPLATSNATRRRSASCSFTEPDAKLSDRLLGRSHLLRWSTASAAGRGRTRSRPRWATRRSAVHPKVGADATRDNESTIGTLPVERAAHDTRLTRLPPK